MPTTETTDRSRPQLVKGIVVSDKMAKTRVIEVKHTAQHHLYHKKQIRRTRIFIHDEKNESHTGDTVLAMSTRPLSKNKHFSLKKVLEKRVAE